MCGKMNFLDSTPFAAKPTSWLRPGIDRPPTKISTLYRFGKATIIHRWKSLPKAYHESGLAESDILRYSLSYNPLLGVEAILVAVEVTAKSST